MSSSRRSMCAAAILLALAAAPAAQPAEPKLPEDGWVSWQVAAVDDAPAWCCWSSRQDRGSSRMACRLDGVQDGYGTRSGEPTTDSVKIYARVTGGKLDRLQALSASCPVEAKTPARVLDDVTADDSARWLISLAKQPGADAGAHRPLVESALAALAMHRGDLARDALANFAHSDSDTEVRKWSVFWLAMVRGAEGADIASSVMFSDPDEDLRKHAAFAVSQTKVPRAAPDLIRLGNTDKAGDVRAQAWFWLAQMGASEAESAITQALRKDTDDHVREQAMFALSQLPEERATRALIAAAEDRSLSVEQRKRAVFWLSQSEAESAAAYLEKMLARTTADL